jgi:hypothetical protein
VTTGDERPELDEQPELTDEQVASYLQVLITHGSLYGPSACSICGVARCPLWVDAYESLMGIRLRDELQ